MDQHWCRPATNAERAPEGLVCEVCGAPMLCEFCDMDDTEVPATHWHVDYATCERHLQIAVSNVHGRTG